LLKVEANWSVQGLAPPASWFVPRHDERFLLLRFALNLREPEDPMEKLASHSSAGMLKRRSFMRGAACAGLFAATAPALGLLAGPANAANWRGFVGCIKPSAGGSSLVDMIRLLPPGIGVAPVYLNLVERSREEFQSSYPVYEKHIAYLAAQRCDLISIEGAPPFMILGADGEAKLVDGWRQKYKTDMFTSSQNQVNVLKAMKLKKIMGVTPFGTDLNKSYARYFEDSGIGVAAMEDMKGAAAASADLPADVMYSFIKKKFLAQKGADSIYILGSGWDTLGIITPLEQDLGVPVVQPVAARVWEIQRRLHVRQPVKGYGILLETLPA
jgi:maleate cis-trans isomerase